MNRNLLLYPVFALVGMTVVVWFAVYVTRLREIRRQRLSPQSLATRAEATAMLRNAAGPSDNLLNLFELPVLFYALMILLYVGGQAETSFLALAWAYVLLRALHSYIHCTYNRVLHRFGVYVAGSLVLWVMWVLFAWRVVTGA